MNSRNMTAMPGRMIEKRSVWVKLALAPAAFVSSVFRRIRRGSRYFAAAVTFFWALPNSGARDSQGKPSSLRSSMARMPLTSSAKAWTTPDSMTAMVLMNSSTIVGQELLGRVLDDKERHRLGLQQVEGEALGDDDHGRGLAPAHALAAVGLVGHGHLEHLLQSGRRRRRRRGASRPGPCRCRRRGPGWAAACYPPSAGRR